MTEHIYLVVYHRILFDIHILSGDIRLGLIVVVVGHEVLHRVVREEGAELGAQLCRQSLVMCEDEGGTVQVGNHVCHSEGLSRAGNTKQGLRALTC